MSTWTTYISPPQKLNTPPDDFAKPHVLLLANPPTELSTYLLYQQTSAFETSKEDGQKKIVFYALAFDKLVQTWTITDITGNYITDDSFARMSVLATIKTVLSCDCDFWNIVDRCYAKTASTLDIDGRVEEALQSFHLVIATLPQAGKDCIV